MCLCKVEMEMQALPARLWSLPLQVARVVASLFHLGLPSASLLDLSQLQLELHPVLPLGQFMLMWALGLRWVASPSLLGHLLPTLVVLLL
jgi:hypothetical protein